MDNTKKVQSSPISERKILNGITVALSDLYRLELDLIKNETEEETISAHIMCVLKKYFTDWKVDIEYNRDGSDTKEDSKDNSIFPDIVIHHRTPDRKERYSPDNNLVAIEVKGYWNREPREKDVAKLVDMKKRYGYRYLFRIELGPDSGHIIPVR